MTEKLTPNLGGVPEKLKDKGIFVHGQEKAKVGDLIEAIAEVEGGKIRKGTRLEIEEIIVEPRGNERGFDKRLKFKGVEGDFNPKKFRKMTEQETARIRHRAKRYTQMDERTLELTPEVILEDFTNYRNNYIDDIPEKRVSQQDPDLDFYKCRAHFFLRILSPSLNMINDNVITDPDVIERIRAFDDFVGKLNDEKFQPDKPVTREDIDEANKFLDYMIEKLKILTSKEK